MIPDETWPPFRVLCVDDNHDCADSTAQLLRIVGFEACACYDGAGALRIAEEFRPSIVILDLNMPGMDGDEVALRLKREQWCPLVLVAMTARSDDESRKRIARAGFQLQLLKPADPEKLILVLDSLMREASTPSTTSQGQAG
jgi:two-component system, OmpR family, response regulator